MAAKEDVLDQYEEPYDPMHPVVCFDESPKQLIAEIELAVLSNMCLTQRIPDKDHLRREVEVNANTRNAKAAPVNWRFTSQDARRKLARLYPRFST